MYKTSVHTLVNGDMQCKTFMLFWRIKRWWWWWC